MAMYHLTVKYDKKTDGTKISPLKHEEYINRKGVYAEQKLTAKQTEAAKGNLICGVSKQNIYEGESAFLYKSPYGNIINTNKGIAVTQNPSYLTLEIALSVAAKMFDEPLKIKGSKTFKENIAVAAALAELPVKFADKNLQKKYDETMKERENEREKFIRNGGAILTAAKLSKPDTNPTVNRTLKSAAKERNGSLRELPKFRLDGGKRRTAMPLPEHPAGSQLEHVRAERNHPVRRDDAATRRNYAVACAEKLIKNMATFKEQLFSSVAEVEYINREHARANRGDCIYKAHRLPQWAKDSPKKFFAAADKYEGKSNRRYCEIEFALPNELTLEQNLEIVNRLIEKQLPDHYYTLAVHDKIGAMSDGVRHPHVHLMFSERIIDDAEKESERPAYKFFRYPNRAATTLAEKRQGGAPKSRKFSDKNGIIELRADFAEIQNEVLKKYCIAESVDHRSLKAMKLEAEMQGNTFLAQLFDRAPVHFIKTADAINENSPEHQRRKLNREQRKRYLILLSEADSVKKEIVEKENKSYAGQVNELVTKLINSNEFIEAVKKSDSDFLKTLQENFFAAVKEVNRYKRIIVTVDEADEQAKIACMTKDERAKWQEYKELDGQIGKWLDFYQKAISHEQDNGKIFFATTEKIQKLQKRADELAPVIEKIKARLKDTDIDCKIRKEKARILFENKQATAKLNAACSHLMNAAETLRQALIEEEKLTDNQEIYTLKELYTVMRRRYYGLKKEYDRKTAELKKLKQQVLSPERAIKMAENKAVDGELKKLNEAFNKLYKQEKYLKNDYDKFNEEITIFAATDTKHLNQQQILEHINKRNELQKRREGLKTRVNELAAIRKDLELQDQKINDFLESPQGQQKICAIAAEILRKNFGKSERYEKAVADLKLLKTNLQTAQKRMNTLKERLPKESADTKYKIVKGGSSGGGGKIHNPPNAIADAMGGDNTLKQLVLRSTDIEDMSKSWELMSEFEKEEEKKKQINRYI